MLGGAISYITCTDIAESATGTNLRQPVELYRLHRVLYELLEMSFKCKCSCCGAQGMGKKCKWPSLMWVMVFGSFLINFTLGIVTSTGNIAPYIISYTRLRSLDPHREVVTLSYAPWLLATGQISQSMIMFLGGIIVKRIGLRLTVLTGCLISSGGMLLSAGAVLLSFWAVVLTYSVMGGIGAGIAQSATLDAAVRCLPQHKGLTMAIILSGYALTPIIFIHLQTAFVNSDNYIPSYYPDGLSGFAYFDQSVVLNLVPFLFLYMGVTLLLIQLTGIAMMAEKSNIHPMVGPKNCKTVLKHIWASFKPETPSCCLCVGKEEETIDEAALHNGGHMVSINNTKTVENKTETKASPSVEVPPWELVKCWDFYLLWLAYMILGGSQIYYKSIYKAFGETFIFSDHLLGIIGSLGAIGAFLSRIPIGIAADRFDCKTILVLGASIAVVFMFNTYTCSLLPAGGSVAFAICFFLISGGLGGMRSVLPVCIAQWYGHANFAVNYGILFTSNVPASILAMLLPPLLHARIGWSAELLLVASFSFLAVVMIIIGGDRRRKNNKSLSQSKGGQ